MLIDSMANSERYAWAFTDWWSRSQTLYRSRTSAPAIHDHVWGVRHNLSRNLQATQDRPADPAAQDTISIVLTKVEHQKVRLTVVNH